MREGYEEAVAALCERLERHDDSRRAVQEKLHEVCNELRRHVDEMEERVNKRLEEEFTEEDNRLQSALSELRRYIAMKKEGKKEGKEGDNGGREEANEGLSKAISDAGSALSVVQSYELVECDSKGSGLLRSYELKVERQNVLILRSRREAQGPLCYMCWAR